MADYTLEQEMEIEALEAILMDDFKEIHAGESGLGTSNRCFQIKISPQDDEIEFESTATPVQLALIFSHSEKYPDEPPLLNLKSLRGIAIEDLRILKEKLQQEASENLGMAMIYTLVTSAKEWLSERFQESSTENAEAEEAAKDEVIVPHGEPVTLDTFLAWREKFEAELALERAKLMPESALTTPKEKKLSGRQWFETGRASAVLMLSLTLAPFDLKGAAAVTQGSDEEDEEDIDFDDEDFEDDEDMLEHYLAEKADISSHSSKIAI